MIAQWDLKVDLDKQIQDLIKLKEKIEKPPKQLKEIIEELAEPGINEIVETMSDTERKVLGIISDIENKTLLKPGNSTIEILNTVKEKSSEITKLTSKAVLEMLTMINSELKAAKLTIETIKLLEIREVEKAKTTADAAKAVADAAKAAADAAKAAAKAAKAAAKAAADAVKKTTTTLNKKEKGALNTYINDLLIKTEALNTFLSNNDTIIKKAEDVTIATQAAATQAPPAQVFSKKELEIVKLAFEIIDFIITNNNKINNEIKKISNIIEVDNKSDEMIDIKKHLDVIKFELKKEKMNKAKDALLVLEADNTERKDKDSIIKILENVISRVNQLLTLNTNFETLEKEITDLITYLNQQIQDIQKFIQPIISSLKGTVIEITKLINEINQKIEKINQRIQEIKQVLETLTLSKSIIENAIKNMLRRNKSFFQNKKNKDGDMI